MVKLAREDIRTPEVLDWKGVHLLHFGMSSCSQKLRIYLNLKKIPWKSHQINLYGNENISTWFLGINPRGLVPVLVHDGDVHIESNDILLYLEKLFPHPTLIPPEAAAEMPEYLKQEDDLHLDFRRLSFRFLFNPPTTPKPPAVLETYLKAGSGTVGGIVDARKAEEIRFWQEYAKDGITDAAVRTAAWHFRQAFDDLNARLARHDYLLGDQITLLDIAWFIYVNRLAIALYPFEKLHPRLFTWYEQRKASPAFAAEVAMPPALVEAVRSTQTQHQAEGKTLVNVAGF